MNLEQKIEAILFWKGEPISRKKLTEILKLEETEINDGIEKLKENLKDRGIVLLETEKEITLGTASELSSLIENLQKEELNKDLSKASLETLSIILYKNGEAISFGNVIDSESSGIKKDFDIQSKGVVTFEPGDTISVGVKGQSSDVRENVWDTYRLEVQWK